MLRARCPRPEAVAVCAVLAPLAIAGCGKSERQRFADRGNRVCLDIGPRVQAGQRRIQAARGRAAATTAGIEQMSVAVTAARARFRAIEAPKELRAEYATYLRDIDRLP